MGIPLRWVRMAHEDRDFVRDTSPEALEVFYEIQRRRSREQKWNDAWALTQGLWNATLAGVRLRYPEATDREVFLRAVSVRTPRGLMIKAYGWDPAEHE
jgi:hypothetical protein